MIRLIVFLLALTGAVMVYASPSPLNSERLIEKLSIQLRGRMASASEKSAFKAAIEAQPDQFTAIYSELIDQWMKDPGYARSIAQLHSVWWRVPIGHAAQHAGEVVAQNRSYREIYQRDYIYVDGASSGPYLQLGVETLTDLPLDSLYPVYVPLAPQEKRFRGFFSSLEFLLTYPDTDTNRNRKRSSQVFRIAFCETLQNLKSNRSHLAMTLEDEHGRNPDCLGCHRRLDPMARFFDQWRPPVGDLPSYDPLQLSRGTVHLGGTFGMDREISGVADSNLGAIVVDQPEFAACVARLAWQYVFGTSVAVQPEQLHILVDRYRSSERMSPVVKDVLLHPYFWSEAEAPPLHYADVKDLLKNCGTCHASSQQTQFNPDSYPFRSDSHDNAMLLKRIWLAINHLPGAKPMPAPPQPRLPIESIEMLRNWLSRGAESEPGRATLTDEQLEAILQ